METKICTKCSKELPATSEYFMTRKEKNRNKIYLRNECKACLNKYHINKIKEYKKNCKNLYFKILLQGKGITPTNENIEIQKLLSQIKDNSTIKYKDKEFKTYKEFAFFVVENINPKLSVSSILTKLWAGNSVENCLLTRRASILQNKVKFIKILNLSTNKEYTFNSYEKASIWSGIDRVSLRRMYNRANPTIIVSLKKSKIKYSITKL